jgi:hypothetical protein
VPAPRSSRIPAAARRLESRVALAPDQCRSLLNELAQISDPRKRRGRRCAGRLASPTCQIIPPGMPGYRPYCPFTVDPDRSGRWVGPDLSKARALVAASGTSGMRVTVWSHAIDRPLARYASFVLQKLGYRARVEILSDAQWPRVVNDARRGAQAGVANWIVSDPTPAEFFDLFFRCSSFRLGDPANTRSSEFFCDPKLDQQMEKADRLRLSDPTRSAALWATIDRQVTHLALWVPLVSEKFPRLRVLSRRQLPIQSCLGRAPRPALGPLTRPRQPRWLYAEPFVLADATHLLQVQNPRARPRAGRLLLAAPDRDLTANRAGEHPSRRVTTDPLSDSRRGGPCRADPAGG